MKPKKYEYEYNNCGKAALGARSPPFPTTIHMNPPVAVSGGEPRGGRQRNQPTGLMLAVATAVGSTGVPDRPGGGGGGGDGGACPPRARF
eukprot:SAG22_NODE_172_length_16609_cov_14.370806_1_plen_89_part_10